MNKKPMNNQKNKYIFLLISIHILIIISLLLVVILSGRDYRDLLLRDDGYYFIAKQFVQGGSLLHKFRGPVLPLMFSILFIFPEIFHPFLRLGLSLMFSAGMIILLSRITRDYLTEKLFFIGSLIFILNLVYIHWTFRNTPEVYLCFFLGLFILNIINYYRTEKVRYLIYASLVFILTFFIKPVFLFIPIALIVVTIIIKSRRLFIYSSILLFIGFFSYTAQDRFTQVLYDEEVTKAERHFEYVHKVLLVSDSFWIDHVLKTRQFHKGTLHSYEVNFEGRETTGDWIRNFYEKYPNGNYVFMNLYFIYDKPLLVIQKLITSPLFYFAMSARTVETLVNLLFSIISLTFCIMGLRIIFKNLGHKEELILMLAVVIGYISLHLLTHSMNRYSMPVLPYLYVWGGVALIRLKGITKKRSKRADTLTEAH